MFILLSIFAELKSLEAEFLNPETTASAERVKLFNVVRDYILSGKYSTYSKAELFMKYRYETDEIIANRLNIKESGVRRARTRLSNDARRAVGINTLKIIRRGTEEEVKSLLKKMSALSIRTGTRQLFPMELISAVNRFCLDDDARYNIEDCQAEIEMLKRFTIPRIRDEVCRVDTDKLNFIFKALDSRASVSDNIAVLSALTSEGLISK